MQRYARSRYQPEHRRRPRGEIGKDGSNSGFKIFLGGSERGHACATLSLSAARTFEGKGQGDLEVQTAFPFPSPSSLPPSFPSFVDSFNSRKLSGRKAIPDKIKKRKNSRNRYPRYRIPREESETQKSEKFRERYARISSRSPRIRGGGGEGKGDEEAVVEYL